ncbi:hypothetical protein A2U01_0063041, partial [Trifolium medium]|nr:hypothetical protein [Trifolium medium]
RKSTQVNPHLKGLRAAQPPGERAGNKHILRAAQTSPARSANHRRTGRTGQTSLRAAQTTLRAAQVTEDEQTHSTRLRAAQHHSARSAAICNILQNAILLE